MNLILIFLGIINFLVFFFLTKRFFQHFSTAFFLSVIFPILPWQTQPVQFQISITVALILTSLFFLVVYGKKELPDIKKLVLLFLLFFLPSLFLTVSRFPTQNLPFVLNQQDIAHITLYQNILNPVEPTLSRLSTNKISLTLEKLEINFFESVDLNHYFFANHPLERVGVKETEKLYSWLLPLFILGCLCLNILAYRPILLWVSSVFLLSGFFSNRFSEITILLMIPFLLIIGLGIEKIRNEVKI